MLRTAGLHHVTAIASDARQNIEFYSQSLGLRLLKETVNFDDPSALHLYYGDLTGRPGTVISFFIWPQREIGRTGTGQAVTVRFSVAHGSLADWAERLAHAGVLCTEAHSPFGEQMLTLVDPDGLRIELVSDLQLSDRMGVPEDVAARCAITGLHSVALSIADECPTRTLLANLMGLEPAATRHGCCRLVAYSEGPGRAVDLFVEPERASGVIGTGTVHHIAFRAGDAPQQRDWQRRLRDEGLDVTEVLDRRYFQSIYFHEPGGVRFEIATDSPGFSVDESHLLEPTGDRATADKVDP